MSFLLLEALNEKGMNLSAVEEWTVCAWHDSNCTQITDLCTAGHY